MASKQRSPNYPALSLPQAIEAVQKLWNVEKRTPTAHEAAAVAMGYKSLSGPARVAIGAMRQYGLIDKPDSGHVRVSDLAVRAILADKPTEREAALAEAAMLPELFQELAATHADASENSIRMYLVTKKGFVDEGARKAARAFRETIGLAKPAASGYDGRDDGSHGEDMTGLGVGAGEGGESARREPPKDGVFSLTVPFSKGTIAVQVRVTGDAISPAHLARVRKYLELAESEWDDGN